jgi:hypothetical protein
VLGIGIVGTGDVTSGWTGSSIDGQIGSGSVAAAARASRAWMS